jgi:hypothetical protein
MNRKQKHAIEMLNAMRNSKRRVINHSIALKLSSLEKNLKYVMFAIEVSSEIPLLILALLNENVKTKTGIEKSTMTVRIDSENSSVLNLLSHLQNYLFTLAQL